MLRFLLLLVLPFFVLAIALTSLSSSSSFALEKLPPWAYLNRTIYPVVHKYDGPRGKPELAIGIISDVQYADRQEHQRRHFRKSPEKLEQCVQEMNANRTHLDFVMHLGDLVDHSMHTNGPPMLKILAKLNYPVYHVLGNHDFQNTPEDKLDEVPKLLGMPSNYYSMLAGRGQRYRLIVLDGNDLSLYATKKGSARRRQSEAMLSNLNKLRAKHGKAFNGGVGDEQLRWLKQSLGDACRMNQRAVIFIHQGLRPEGERTNLWNDFVLVQTISTFHCLVAVINGHAHKFLYDFKYTKYRQVHFITYGGMVQSPFTSFGFADFYDDELHLHGLIFGRQIEYHLNLTQHHTALKPLVAEEHGDGSRSSPPSKPTIISPLLLLRGGATKSKGDQDGGRTAAAAAGEGEGEGEGEGGGALDREREATSAAITSSSSSSASSPTVVISFYDPPAMGVLLASCGLMLGLFVWWLFGGVHSSLRRMKK